MLSDADFLLQSERLLEGLVRLFEAIPGSDVEGGSGTLTASFPPDNSQTYLLTGHGVLKQIWMVSPCSGAHHFHYVDNLWRHTRTGETIIELLTNEIGVPFQDALHYTS